MNLNDYTTLKLSSQYLKRDFNAQLRDFRLVVRTLIEMTDHLHNAKTPIIFWRKHMEANLVKLSMHSSTLADILPGTTFYNPVSKTEIKYPDLPSIFLLVRAIIENYLTFYYLNVQPENERAEFRFYLYEFAGLSSRQKFETTFPGVGEELAKELQAKKDYEAKQIQDLLSKIRANSYFSNLKKERQDDLIKNKKAKELSWTDLIQNSTLNSSIFLNLWRLFSNHAHSEMLSSIQLKGYVENKEKLREAQFTSIVPPLMLNALAIKDLTRMYPIMKIVYNALPTTTTTIIDSWDEMAKEKTGHNRRSKKSGVKS